MLPGRHRIRERADFLAVAKGRRSAGSLLVVHCLSTGASRPPRVGFAVSRAVGNAVVRNRTKRRLRAATNSLIPRFPAGCDLLIRALPGAGSSSSAQLAAELERLLSRLGGIPGGKTRVNCPTQHDTTEVGRP